MLFKEIIAVYSENHTKAMNTLCGQNAELLIAKAAHIVTTGLQSVSCNQTTFCLHSCRIMLILVPWQPCWLSWIWKIWRQCDLPPDYHKNHAVDEADRKTACIAIWTASFGRGGCRWSFRHPRSGPYIILLLFWREWRWFTFVCSAPDMTLFGFSHVLTSEKWKKLYNVPL
jgi:hypothetical protein